MSSSPPLLTCALVILAAGALVAGQTAEEHVRRRRAAYASIAAFALVGAAALALLISAEESWNEPWLGSLGLGLDRTMAVWSSLVALLGTAVIVGAPRRARRDRIIPASLAITASSLLVIAGQDLLLVAFGWLLGPIALLRSSSACEPSDFEVSPQSVEKSARLWRQTARYYLVWGSLPLIAAVVVWLLAAPSGASVDHIHASEVSPQVRRVTSWLVALAALIRLGAFPFQSWVPVILRGAPLGPAALLVGSQTGIALLSRIGLPMAQSADGDALANALLPLGLATAFYGAVLSLGQHATRRILGFVVISQTSMALAGLSAEGPTGHLGAIAQALSSGVSLVAVCILVWGLLARFGTDAIDKLGGLAHVMPRSAALFLLVTVAAAGFPGGVAFVAEDLVVHGVVHEHPLMGAILLIGIALNAFSMIRAFTRLYFGPPRGIHPSGEVVMPDLLPREKWVIVGLIASLLLPGALPQTLMATHRAPPVAEPHADMHPDATPLPGALAH